METATPPRRRILLFCQRAVLSLMTVSVLGIASGQSPTDGLKFTISLQATEFKPGQPVILQMKLENVSDHDLVVNTRFLVNAAVGPHEVVLQVLGPDKTTLSFQRLIRADFQSDTYVRLPSHQAVTKAHDISKDFNLTPRGDYSVRAYYQNEDDARAKMNLPAAWKGTLESNRVQFTLR